MAISSLPASTIPPGSWILITGATGYVATQTIRTFLSLGYKVRGTVRSQASASWLTNDLFASHAACGFFTLVEVPDLAAPHAFDEAVRGVSAIVHIASVVSFSDDPNEVIPQTVRGVLGIAEAALKEAGVRVLVYTSSIVASTLQTPGEKKHVERNTFNEDAVKLAWDPARIGVPGQGGIVYMASKTEAEKALWEFVEREKPHFTVNVVCPATIMGETLHHSQLASNGAWVKMLYDGKTDALEGLKAVFHIDVKDTALLHVAATLDPEVKEARLQAWADACNWNDVLAIMRRICPEKKFIEDLPGMGRLEFTADFEQPLGLLKKWGGQDSWRRLEETVIDNMRAITAWDPECDPCGTGWMP